MHGFVGIKGMKWLKAWMILAGTVTVFVLSPMLWEIHTVHRSGVGHTANMTQIPNRHNVTSDVNTVHRPDVGHPTNTTEMQSRDHVTSIPTQSNHQACSEEYRRSHWISTPGIGRTGNKMFQLATLLATAKLTCRTPAISLDMDKHLGSIFNLSQFVKIDIKNDTKNWHHFHESCRHSWQLLGLDPTFNWTINGYLNSWKHFKFYSTYIRSVFTFKKHIVDSAQRFLSDPAIAERCPKKTSLKIGIHIRRGDFLQLYKAGFRVADANYTHIARDYFRKQFPSKTLCFIVVSTDLKWCKENIKGDNVFYTSLKTPGEDMALLSLCNHTIMSTGTFGWFGAWLSGGKVVYSSDFPRRNTNKCPSNDDDHMLSDWIGLP